MVVVSVVGSLTALFVFGILRDPTRRDDIPSALLNRPTPAFTMPLFDRYRTEFGTEFRVAERSKPMVVNFWASWCLPCREEMPILESGWRDYKESVLFVGVNTQERHEGDARAFLNEFSPTYPNGMDKNNRINIDYGLFGLPETFFIRADGTLQYRHSGAVTREVMDEQIQALLEGS